MSIKIAFSTTSRSDYGPSFWLIHDLFRDNRFETNLVVGGSHLSGRHGMTVCEIERDGWPIAARIPFMQEKESDVAHGSGAGRALAAYTKLLADMRPDLLILYGDRYELLPIATAAVITRTPLAHLCGGDITEGAVDDQVRHALTKIAHLHFPSTTRSAARILQMGEEAWRVHNVGDPALDHFVRGERAPAEELAEALGFMPDRETLIVTFHPVTLELEDMHRQARELAEALWDYSGSVVITAPAPDPGSDVIRRELEELSRKRPHTVFVESLGSRRYRGLIHIAGAMAGNSSSGLNEAPCARLPTVNIGRRQEGRERSANVIDALPERAAILDGIHQALEEKFRSSLSNLATPYGDGRSGPRIISVLEDLPDRARLMNKRFCDNAKTLLP